MLLPAQFGIVMLLMVCGISTLSASPQPMSNIEFRNVTGRSVFDSLHLFPLTPLTELPRVLHFPLESSDSMVHIGASIIVPRELGVFATKKVEAGEALIRSQWHVLERCFSDIPITTSCCGPSVISCERHTDRLIPHEPLPGVI